MGVIGCILVVILTFGCGLNGVEGQGAMRVPPGRSVMWAPR